MYPNDMLYFVCHIAVMSTLYWYCVSVLSIPRIGENIMDYRDSLQPKRTYINSIISMPRMVRHLGSFRGLQGLHALQNHVTSCDKPQDGTKGLVVAVTIQRFWGRRALHLVSSPSVGKNHAAHV